MLPLMLGSVSGTHQTLRQLRQGTCCHSRVSTIRPKHPSWQQEEESGGHALTQTGTQTYTRVQDGSKMGKEQLHKGSQNINNNSSDSSPYGLRSLPSSTFPLANELCIPWGVSMSFCPPWLSVAPPDLAKYQSVAPRPPDVSEWGNHFLVVKT